MFAGKAKAYPNESPFRCSTITPIRKIQLERPARGGQTLLRTLVNYVRYMFYNIGARGQEGIEPWTREVLQKGKALYS